MLKSSRQHHYAGRWRRSLHDFINRSDNQYPGYSELILGRCEPDDPGCLAEPVEQISRAATRAAALTRQLLAFGSRQPSEQKDIVLNEVVGGVEKMLRRLIGVSDVDLNSVSRS